MTAEIAILNRSGIALAADSAVTVGGKRVWKTTNKIYSLSPLADVAIMVFGSAEFIGFPWEVVIKQFRKSISVDDVESVSDIASQFFDFLSSDKFKNENQCELSVFYIIVDLIERIKANIESSGKIDLRNEVSDALDMISDAISEFDPSSGLPKSTFEAEFGSKCVEFFREELGVHVTKKLKTKIINTCFEVLTRACKTDHSTGVVFAGFGASEMLPVLEEYVVDGRFQSYVRKWRVRRRDLSDDEFAPGLIIPFGQGDVARSFMEGIEEDHEVYLREMMLGLLEAKSDDLIDGYVHPNNKVVEKARQSKDNQKLVSEFFDEFEHYKQKRNVQPVMSVISSLPKEEMAAMAEALVDITSLRRKVDSRIETVAGPIDVAFISKGDGFIWIKRKHYFDIKLNGDFVVRKSREAGGGNGSGE